MRIKYLSHHDKAERGNENEAKCPAIISSCQLKEIRTCNSSACQQILEEKLAHKLEENDLLHSHSDEFEPEEGCTDQKMAGHQAETIKQEDAVSLKMEVVSHNETDPESLYGPVETVFIKEEVLEDERTDEDALDTLKNEMVCKDEAESVVPHSTDEPVWTPKIKEKWWQCQNALREQSVVSLHNTATTLNGGDDPESVHRPIESVYIKKENVESDTDEEHMSDSQDTETSMSSEAVSASDHFAFESAYIKKEDINLESDDEDSSNSEALDNKVHVKKQRRRKICHKKGETEEERKQRLEKQRSYYFKRRVHETQAQREERLKKIKENAKKRRLKETEEERALRLKEKRTYETQRLENESPEKRALRLEKQRLYQAQRVKHETPEERAQRLENKRLSYQRRQLIKNSLLQ